MDLGEVCDACPPPAEGGFWWNLFTTDFVPRAQCVGGRGEVIWLHVCSDAAIALAYYSIPIALAVFVRRRRDIAFPWIFWLFAAFILACGTTHAFNILAFWHPLYRLDGLVKAATAAISVVTACLLWPLVPRALSLPSPSQLRSANEALLREVQVRRDAESRLAAVAAELEGRVAIRTEEIESTNASLLASQHRLEHQLAEIEAIYARAPIGLCFVDALGRVARINDAFARAVAVDADGARGCTFDELRPDKPASQSAIVELAGALREVLKTGTPITAKPMEEPSDLGSRRPRWLVSIYEVRVAGGDRAGACICLQDVTERHELEARILQSQKTEAIGQLASGIAHEINNGLTAIYGYLSLARATCESSHPVAPYLEHILAAAEQASGITKSLLTFARGDLGERSRVDVVEVVERVVTMLKGLLPSNVRVTLDLADTGPIAVVGNANQLQQLLLNLILNARDAMPTGGELVVSLAPATGAGGRRVARLTVKDSGIGMTPEVAARIFEPFFTTKPRGQGTGLGMAVVEGIVRSHHGEIRVETAVGRGTAFVIDLPLSDGAAGAPAATPASHPPDARGTLVIAEDNGTIRQLLSEGLRKHGFQVREAVDGRDCLEILAALAAEGIKPTVILLDVDMPRVNGLECLSALRAGGDATPVVVMTGGPVAPLHTPNAVVLPKPFHTKDLVEAIGRAMRTSSSRG